MSARKHDRGQHLMNKKRILRTRTLASRELQRHKPSSLKNVTMSRYVRHPHCEKQKYYYCCQFFTSSSPHPGIPLRNKKTTGEEKEKRLERKSTRGRILKPDCHVSKLPQTQLFVHGTGPFHYYPGRTQWRPWKHNQHIVKLPPSLLYCVSRLLPQQSHRSWNMAFDKRKPITS